VRGIFDLRTRPTLTRYVVRVANRAGLNGQIEDYLSKHEGKFFSGTDKPGLGDVSGAH
jgi:hypothetical protein